MGVPGTLHPPGVAMATDRALGKLGSYLGANREDGKTSDVEYTQR